MIKNYLLIALKNFRKQKLFSLINILGLTIGITCCLMIFLFILNEFSYDNFHKKRNRIYHAFLNVASTNGFTKITGLPVPMMPSLKEEYPDVQYYSRYISGNGNIRYNNKQLVQNLRFTDPDFFKMFSFGFVEGRTNCIE